MRISPIQQQNYNNSNLNFKGSIDKSFTKYLKTVRSDIIRTQSDSKVFNIETIKEAKVLIKNIVTKLKPFMEQTSANTVLYLAKSRDSVIAAELGDLRFKDLETGTEVSATRLTTDNLIEGAYTKIIVTPLQDSPVLRFIGVRGKHDNVSDLRFISDWTDALTKGSQPEHVDISLMNASLMNASLVNKREKDFNKIFERAQLSAVEKRKLEMKDAIKELKDIEI